MQLQSLRVLPLLSTTGSFLILFCCINSAASLYDELVVVVNNGLLIASDTGIVEENADANPTILAISRSVMIPIGILTLSVVSFLFSIIILPISF